MASLGSFGRSTILCPKLVSAVTCRYDFDPLDVTKTWPEDIFPLQPVGRMVLNRNVDNFFNENEQLAFSPGVIVPGTWRCLLLCHGPVALPAMQLADDV